MKRLSVLIFFTLVVLGIKAQAETTDKVKTYIEIYSWHKSSTPTIDTGFGKGNESYRTEDGKSLSSIARWVLLIGLLAMVGNWNHNICQHVMTEL